MMLNVIKEDAGAGSEPGNLPGSYKSLYYCKVYLPRVSLSHAGELPHSASSPCTVKYVLGLCIFDKDYMHFVVVHQRAK